MCGSACTGEGEARPRARQEEHARVRRQVCACEWCTRVEVRARLERWVRREGLLLRSAGEFRSGGVQEARERGRTGVCACVHEV